MIPSAEGTSPDSSAFKHARDLWAPALLSEDWPLPARCPKTRSSKFSHSEWSRSTAPMQSLPHEMPCQPVPHTRCPDTVSRLGSWARTGFPFLELPEVTLCQSSQCSSHRVLREWARARPCLESATWKHRQQLYLKAIIHFLALQSRNITWPGSGLLAYVFYLLSPIHHHLAAGFFLSLFFSPDIQTA